MCSSIFCDDRDHCFLGGVADWDEQEGALVGRSVQDLSEETHRTGSVAQGGKTSPVESSEQETGGDADTFLNIVVFDLATVGGEAIINSEYDYKIWCGFKEGLLPVGSEGSEGVEPVLGETVFVIFALFFFGSNANLVLEVCRGNYNKTPRLLVSAGGG